MLLRVGRVDITACRSFEVNGEIGNVLMSVLFFRPSPKAALKQWARLALEAFEFPDESVCLCFKLTWGTAVEREHF
jgi:hypothetical protein